MKNRNGSRTKVRNKQRTRTEIGRGRGQLLHRNETFLRGRLGQDKDGNWAKDGTGVNMEMWTRAGSEVRIRTLLMGLEEMGRTGQGLGGWVLVRLLKTEGNEN